MTEEQKAEWEKQKDEHGDKFKTAAGPSGLYGFTKRTQNDCEAAGRKLSRVAARLAKKAWKKDDRSAAFLLAHSKRAKSQPARILAAAMKDLYPKMAKEARLEELRRERSGEDKMAKEAAEYGLYGYSANTARLGLSACTALREEAGRIASGLHGRRTEKHANIVGFLDNHCKTGRCAYSRLLRDSYPDADVRCASDTPKTVEDWIAWEDEA
jgi:uncharacterized membrane protein